MTIAVGPGRPCTGITAALNLADEVSGPVSIELDPGVYREKLAILRPGIAIYGTAAEEVRIVWDDGASTPHGEIGRLGTFNSYTLYLGAPDCRLSDVTVENAAGPGETAGQAVALYADADRILVERCRLVGHQDTVCTGPLPDDPPPKSPPHLLPYHRIGPDRPPFRQWYRDCRIVGDIDFIFGSARALFQNCEIASRRRSGGGPGYICAPSHPAGETWGFVFSRCRLTGDAPEGSVYLGRPWRKNGRAGFFACSLGGHIHRAGWHNWDDPENEAAAGFTEVGSSGPGAADGTRVGWARTQTAGAVPSPEDIFGDWDPEYSR